MDKKRNIKTLAKIMKITDAWGLEDESKRILRCPTLAEKERGIFMVWLSDEEAKAVLEKMKKILDKWQN